VRVTTQTFKIHSSSHWSVIFHTLLVGSAFSCKVFSEPLALDLTGAMPPDPIIGPAIPALRASRYHKLTNSSATAKSTVRPSCLVGVLYFSGENLLMANQPFLRNWPRKLPNSAKGTIITITPFKVIEGHQCWYQLKAHARLFVRTIR